MLKLFSATFVITVIIIIIIITTIIINVYCSYSGCSCVTYKQ